MTQRVISTGIINIRGKWLWLSCCLDTILYYQRFLEKIHARKISTPIWKSHITVVRGSDDFNVSKLGFLEGKEISFRYYPEEINTNGLYWWIEVFSKELEELRFCLGLDPRPKYDFHLTIGKEIPTRLKY